MDNIERANRIPLYCPDCSGQNIEVNDFEKLDDFECRDCGNQFDQSDFDPAERYRIFVESLR